MTLANAQPIASRAPIHPVNSDFYPADQHEQQQNNSISATHFNFSPFESMLDKNTHYTNTHFKHKLIFPEIRIF